MDLYTEEILDHAEHPHNQGEIEGEGVVSVRDSNASCGDMVQFFVKIERVKNTDKSEKSVITDVKWKGIGCAVTTASASKLSDYLTGKTVKQIKDMTEEELVSEAVGFDVNPGRAKCLMLPVVLARQLILKV